MPGYTPAIRRIKRCSSRSETRPLKLTAPSRRTVAVSPTAKTVFMSWVTKMTAVPLSAKPRIAVSTSLVCFTPKAAVGSSRITTGAPLPVARAIATACRWPPEVRRVARKSSGNWGCPGRPAPAWWHAWPQLHRELVSRRAVASLVRCPERTWVDSSRPISRAWFTGPGRASAGL